MMQLMDIIGRLGLPPLDEIPDEDAFGDDEHPANWRIPQSRITVQRIEDGPRDGEFLFSSRTVALTPEFHNRIIHRPQKIRSATENWYQASLQGHGAMIPGNVVINLPESLKRPVAGNPVWKLLAAAILVILAIVLLIIIRRLSRSQLSKSKLNADLRRLLLPVATILTMYSLDYFVRLELIVTGGVAVTFDDVTTIVEYLAFSWAFWIVTIALAEWVILSPQIPDESLDADMLRLGARVAGFVGGVSILAYGAQDLGIPVVGLVAGLGVGGLAVALAVRPTLENLIAGVILYTDRPVSVGDYCSFDTHTGIIERIGLRSTQLRALDRTIVTIPNATLADTQIVNWARCDRMLIKSMIGLRYETKPDQLRYVLAKLREMFLAHPKIDHETVRVRFVGHGDSSLDIEIRVLALTREWNEFYAIREDVLLRATDIVNSAGTGGKRNGSAAEQKLSIPGSVFNPLHSYPGLGNSPIGRMFIISKSVLVRDFVERRQSQAPNDVHQLHHDISPDHSARRSWHRAQIKKQNEIVLHLPDVAG